MYDADKTGILNMNELAFDNIDRSSIEMYRQAYRPSKDAEQFFNNYPAGKGQDIARSPGDRPT